MRLDKFERAVALAGDLAGVAVRTEFADDAQDGSSTLKVVSTTDSKDDKSSVPPDDA